MSIEVMTLVFKRSLGSVTRKAVLLAMADAANDDGSGVWKSADTIAEQCDVTKRTVLRTWSSLEEDGLIRRVGYRTVKGGKVIIWGLDTRAISALPRPGDILSPSDTVSSGEPGDTKSPGDIDATDPVTLTPEPGDTVSPKPSKNHPIEPSTACVRETIDEILGIIPKAKSRMAPRDSLPKVVKSILRKTDPESLINAVRRCYSTERHTVEEGQYAPAIYSWLSKGVWKNWIDETEGTASSTLTDAEWAQAFRHYVDHGEWVISDISPAPHEAGCTAPAKMLRHAASLLPDRSDAITSNIQQAA